ncbi:YbaN family protein [Salinicola avicenniae]|uniref:YbaN family protein n=1 Tax=Salinicola avicenniae TaxID=2916836 RepID=UPI0020734115|nr:MULTISPECIES: YbaN family protein [unclassified Salinicola]
MRNALYVTLAAISFALGVIGLFLPVMPTTCFMLAAVWLASRGSPRFANWIRNHPRFGPPIQSWERERAIPKHAKIMAVCMLTLSCVIIAFTVSLLPLKLGLILGLVALAIWIVTRPLPSLQCPMRELWQDESSPERR